MSKLSSMEVVYDLPRVTLVIELDSGEPRYTTFNYGDSTGEVILNFYDMIHYLTEV